jgi:hypothetical protein
MVYLDRRVERNPGIRHSPRLEVYCASYKSPRVKDIVAVCTNVHGGEHPSVEPVANHRGT